MQITAAREFVRNLPPPSEAPFITINDYVQADVREAILNELAEEGSRHQRIRVLARTIIEELTLRLRRPPSVEEIAQAALDAVHDLVEYGDDPPDLEQYSRAVTTIEPVQGMPISPVTGKPKGRGDCDDLAVLFSAICRAAGVSSSVIWVDQRRADFNHIAATVCLPNGQKCYWVEPTVPGARIGESTQSAVRRLGIRGRADLA